MVLYYKLVSRCFPYPSDLSYIEKLVICRYVAAVGVAKVIDGDGFSSFQAFGECGRTSTTSSRTPRSAGWRGRSSTSSVSECRHIHAGTYSRTNSRFAFAGTRPNWLFFREPQQCVRNFQETSHAYLGNAAVPSIGLSKPGRKAECRFVAVTAI